MKAFGSEGKKTAVISTVIGDANAHLYGELATQQIDASKIPFMALSVSERELRSVDLGRLAGHMAARNYFQSVKSAENDAFIKMWANFNEQRDKITNDPMEATFIGFRMWAQAVSQAGTTDVNAVRQAMYGQRVRAPSGFEVVMNTNHHLSKPAMIGKLEASGSFDVVWRSISPIKASVWSRYLPESAKTCRRLDISLGLRRMYRADIQGLVTGRPRAADAGPKPRANTEAPARTRRHQARQYRESMRLNARSSRRGLRAARWRSRRPTSSRRPRGASRSHRRVPSGLQD